LFIKEGQVVYTYVYNVVTKSFFFFNPETGLGFDPSGNGGAGLTPPSPDKN
jgi:hypothetical protein